MKQSEISTALGRSPLSNYEFLRLKEQMQMNHMSRVDRLRYSTDASLFSTSLPAMFHEKLNLRDEEDNLKSIDGRVSDLNKLGQGSVALNHSQSTKCQDLGNLPDDEEELLAGIIESFDLNGLLSSEAEESEEYDLFISGGGLELDFDTHENMNGSTNTSGSLESFINNGSSYVASSVAGALPGEHPYGEHPSRTLFVRNINSNVEDSELRALFEQYGTIRTLYTACKHRGFVMISYYDIRAARSAMRALQNKPLRRRKLDIHFSIPKDNPSEKDVNQGTLVVFNLDPSVSNEDLLHIFGAFGEVKEIRETPHKRHHKFIEFYDVRAAEEALKHLNRIDIAGKRIKLEPSRPGGTRRSWIQHLESEQDDARSYRPQTGSPVTSSPPVGSWVHFHSPSDEGSFQNIHQSPGVVNGNSFTQKPLPGLGAILPHMMSPSANIIHTGNEMGSQFHHPHSFPENGSMLHMPHYGSPVTCGSPSYGPPGAIGVPNGGPYPQAKSTPVSSTLSRPQFHWSTQPSYGVQNPAWPPGFTPNGTQAQHPGFLYPGRHSYMNPVQLASHHPPHHHHVGSAPPEETFHHGYFAEPSEPSFMQPRSFNGMGFVNGSPLMNVGGVAMPGNGVVDNGSPSFALRSAQQACHMYPPGPHPGPIPIPGDAPERVRNRRAENTANQVDNKKQYQLDLDKIISGEDTRTTLMIKNIPNKYTSKMLLAAIDEHHRGTYDFLYLPIDFKNKCNVGYAFLNMTSPSHIISFYKTFNGKKWEKFNSEKVASIAYARIQGKAALVTHFQNSSLMNEDKRCRPILFHSDGPEEPFPLTINHKVRPNENLIVGDRSSPSPASKDEGEKANFHAENDVEKAKSGSSEDAEQ